MTRHYLVPELTRVGAPLGLALLVLGCSHLADDCRNTLTCVRSDTGGTDAGSSGGRHATGGVGSGGITSACTPACTGDKPVCNESVKACVECTSDTQCSGAKSKCKTADTSDAGTGVNTCVECTRNEHCSGNTPLCDGSTNKCVECVSNSDCPEAAASLCSAGTCSPCTQDTDCTHIGGKTVCNRESVTNPDAGTSANTCVQCTGTKYSACQGDAGTPQVCDSLNNTCTDNAEHSAELCQPCVSDAQCKLGRACVNEQFGTSTVGYFCFFKQGDTTNGAPADCTTTGRPYFSTIAATTIDGQDATICALRASTCVAMNQYSQTSCTTSPGAPDNSKCGFAPGIDSQCASIGSQYRCTVACLSDDDCPPNGGTPITCSITAGTRKYCSL